MRQLRKSMFSGSWYPSQPSECKKMIDSFLKEYPYKKSEDKNYKGGIVPHAGWVFSGSIACNVIHRLSQGDKPDVIVVFGMHLGEGSPAYMMADGAWETPFGELPVHTELANALTQHFHFQLETPLRFKQDNTIELQLPFIKYFYNDIQVVTMGIPPTVTSLEIGKSIVKLSKQLGLSIQVIGSTDLTHYGLNYGFTPAGSGKKALEWVKQENDRHIIDAMLSMDPQLVLEQAKQRNNACCAGAAATAIAAGNALNVNMPELVAYGTSYDKQPADSYVGYAGIIF